jgi:hypothetical protein
MYGAKPNLCSVLQKFPGMGCELLRQLSLAQNVNAMAILGMLIANALT